jgi:hypothetical protein
MNDATKHLLEAGILGPVLVIAVYYIWHLTRTLSSVQEKRVAEHKEMLGTLMRMSERWMTALNANTRALEGQKKAMTELKTTLESLKDD